MTPPVLVKHPTFELNGGSEYNYRAVSDLGGCNY